LKKITEDANSRLPKIWWYDLEGDLDKAEKQFAILARLQKGKVVEAKTKHSPNGVCLYMDKMKYKNRTVEQNQELQ
jgi:hypothetical protein